MELLFESNFLSIKSLEALSCNNQICTRKQ